MCFWLNSTDRGERGCCNEWNSSTHLVASCWERNRHNTQWHTTTHSFCFSIHLEEVFFLPFVRGQRRCRYHWCRWCMLYSREGANSLILVGNEGKMSLFCLQDISMTGRDISLLFLSATPSSQSQTVQWLLELISLPSRAVNLPLCVASTTKEIQSCC